MEKRHYRAAVRRWDLHQRIQHIGMFSTFILCTITGLPFKWHDNSLSLALARWFGGPDTMLNIHIGSGLTMIAVSIYHLVWLFYKMLVKKDLGWAIMPTLKDVTDLVQHLKYQLGLTDQPARFDRYSYKEKFDYWAVFWGMFIIGGSGIFMMMPEWGAALMPRWLIDCWRIGHSDEAVLAILAIFVWHFYNVHFSPDFFPGSTTWFNGLMDIRVMEHEHPLELERIKKEQEKIILIPEEGQEGEAWPSSNTVATKV